MAADETKETLAGRSYTELHVVADTLERDEHVTFGVIYEGAFVPIAQQHLGLVEAMKRNWNELGGTRVKSKAAQSTQALETRLADLERTVMELQAKVDPAGGEQQQPPDGEQQHQHE